MTAERGKEREHERSEGWDDIPSLPQASIGAYLEAKVGSLAAVGMSDSASGMSELSCIERPCIDLAVELRSAHRCLPSWIRTTFGSLGYGLTSHVYILHTVRFNERYVCESIKLEIWPHGTERAASEFLEFCHPSILSRVAP